MVEGVKVVIFCHFRENEAMRPMVEGVKVVIFCHFWENEAFLILGKSRKIPGMGWAGWAGWLAGWLAGSACVVFYCFNNSRGEHSLR